MPLVRVLRYQVSGPVLVDYFMTVTGDYDADSATTVIELDPSLVPSVGECAVVRATGSVVNWVGGTAGWIGGSHPSGYTITGVSTGSRVIGGTTYSCVLVTVE